MDPKRNSGTAFDGQYQEIQVFTRTQLEHRIPFLANQASFTRKLKVFLKIRSLPTK